MVASTSKEKKYFSCSTTIIEMKKILVAIITLSVFACAEISEEENNLVEENIQQTEKISEERYFP